MTTPRFLITQYDHHWVGQTLHVTCQTDIPCHMTLAYSQTPPTLHLRSHERRGLKLKADPEYSFVVFEEVDQTEPGDTLAHTFTYPAPQPPSLSWWAFRATIAGQPSPSTSPLCQEA